MVCPKKLLSMLFWVCSQVSLFNRPWSRPESAGELSVQFYSWYHLN